MIVAYSHWATVFETANKVFKPLLVRQTLVTWVHDVGHIPVDRLSAMLYHTPYATNPTGLVQFCINSKRKPAHDCAGEANYMCNQISQLFVALLMTSLL